MQNEIRINAKLSESLCCPICRDKIHLIENEYACKNENCGFKFPVVNGIPVLINEKSSIFSIDDFVSHKNTFFSNEEDNNFTKILKKFIPDISMNIYGPKNFNFFREKLLDKSSSAKVLVLGGSILGQGMEAIINEGRIEFVETDVSFGPRTMLICDAHDIPFDEGTFDGVIVQAVLEHVADPFRCVTEIHRVLKDGGLVYAEIPFMQQMHCSPYDFTRFTIPGMRRLFKKFEEIKNGAVCGPGMALAWSYQHFLQSFSESAIIRSLAGIFARFTSFYLKYLDYYLINKPGTLHAASGFYFMGKKNSNSLSDRDLITLYKKF